MSQDFGFSTISAEDYAKLTTPKTIQTTVPSPVDLSSMTTRIDAMITMIEAIDNKLDATNNKVEAIGVKVGAVEDVLKSDTGEDLVDRSKLQKMADLIMPLLKNLRDTAKDEYIRWPNRAPVIQAQINAIEALLE